MYLFQNSIMDAEKQEAIANVDKNEKLKELRSLISQDGDGAWDKAWSANPSRTKQDTNPNLAQAERPHSLG